MAITNLSKPTPAITNQTRINIGETWASIPTTWASETRTWADMASIITNGVKNGLDALWNISTLPWQLALPWSGTQGITNQNKP